MPTLAGYRREMTRLEPALGSAHLINTAAARQITVNTLKYGARSSVSRYSEKFMLRADSASLPADRVRLSYDYDPVAGTIAHEGADYADVTAGTEILEILEHEPYLYDEAIQETLRSTRYRDVEILPTHNADRYWLDQFSWMTDPGHIIRVGWRQSPVMTGNRNFEKWNVISTAGALQPDLWTLGAESGGVYSRSTTARRGAYSLSVQRVGTDVTVSLTIPVMETGVSQDSVQGLSVTGVLVCRSANASSVTVKVDSQDASAVSLSSTTSDAHSGDGTWEELTSVHTVNAAAEQLVMTMTVAVNETILMDEFYLMKGTLTDSVRRDIAGTAWNRFTPEFEQGQPLQLIAPKNIGLGQQIVIESERPYATFDETRVRNQTADLDSLDAPLRLIATGAVYRLYEKMGPDTQALAEKWRLRYQEMAARHLAVSRETDLGINLFPPHRMVPSARVR